jgi:hypothetical protein
MTHLLFTIKLHVALNLSEPEIRQIVEEALSMACSKIETIHRPDSIGYRVEEL